MGEMRVERAIRAKPVAGRSTRQQLERREVMVRKMDAAIKKLQLPEIAKDLIRIYKLDRHPTSKSYLRHEMQRGLLKSIKNKRFEETRALSILNAATTIEHTLCQSESRKIPLDEAIVVHEAALFIAETALKKCSKEKPAATWKGLIQNLSKDLKEMKQKFGKQPNKEIKADFERLCSITNEVNNLIDAIIPQKGYFVGKGLNEIEAIARWAFKSEQQ